MICRGRSGPKGCSHRGAGAGFRLAFALCCVAASIVLHGSSLASPAEDDAVWRVQLGVQMADVEHAGTDDWVRARLGSSRGTWMDYGRNDFERGRFYRFDLTLDGVSQFRDIQELEISKTWSDGMCIDSIHLFVNDRVIYSRSFLPPGLWLDDEGGYERSVVVSHDELRASPQWRSYKQPFFPQEIPNDEIDSRVEGIVGDALYGSPLAWHHENPVKVRKNGGSGDAVRVGVDLKWYLEDWLQPAVRVDFDLALSCADGQMRLTAGNAGVDIDVDLFFTFLTFGLVDVVVGEIENAIERSFRFSKALPVPFCPTIDVTAGGDFVLSM